MRVILWMALIHFYSLSTNAKARVPIAKPVVVHFDRTVLDPDGRLSDILWKEWCRNGQKRQSIQGQNGNAEKIRTIGTGTRQGAQESGKGEQESGNEKRIKTADWICLPRTRSWNHKKISRSIFFDTRKYRHYRVRHQADKRLHHYGIPGATFFQSHPNSTHILTSIVSTAKKQV